MLKPSDLVGEVVSSHRPELSLSSSRDEDVDSAPTRVDPECWLRVKTRLRAEVGDDVFLSWFASMDVDRIEGDTARLSVPTRFLKSWIQSHYVERVLACWQAEQPSVRRVELVERSALRCTATKAKADVPEPVREVRPAVRDSASCASSQARFA